MLNREKYAKEILDIACQGDCVAKTHGMLIACRETKCALCDFNGPIDPNCCEYKRLEWANSECVEPPVDWSKVPVDTPILVKNYAEKGWKKRYFAGHADEKIYTWPAGATSWSNESGGAYAWDYAKLAESEDQNENKQN